jgi:hypothetical protein
MLRELNCNNNQLTQIDLTDNTQLRELKCQYNQLTTLNIKSELLEKINCSYNMLEKLIFADNTKTRELICNNNKLSELTLPYMPNLDYFACAVNNLSTLDISPAPNIRKLDCHSNKIETLNISKNETLRSLNCAGNFLSKLNLSQNSKLEFLDCSQNNLRKIDASNSPSLYDLFATQKDSLKPSVKLSWNKELSVDNNNKIVYGNKRELSPEMGIALDGGYFTIPYKKLHAGYLGGEITFSPYRKYPYGGETAHQFFLGGGVYYGKFNGTKEVVPVASLCYSTGSVAFLDFKVTASKYHVNPSVGLNLINFIKLNMGYSIGTKMINGMKMNGFSFSINICLGGGNYYPDLST